MTIAILGRQPHLGLAELEAVFGSDTLQPLGTFAAQLAIDPRTITHQHLGGTIKLAEAITSLPTTDWHAITTHLVTKLPQYLSSFPEGKLTLGLSAYGLRVTSQQLQRTALELKKIIRNTGRPVRIVPNKDLALNSAQVVHNRLHTPSGMELLLISHRGHTYLARTISVQDVERYATRDFDRPKRDAFVGMLPPKLAQIMINLAKPEPDATVLDPFCGTGVLLMEAALQGYTITGSDISQKMIEYSRENLHWLGETYHFTPAILELTTADATQHTWPGPISTVTTETYLGQPLSGLPNPQKLAEIIKNCDVITRKFLINLRPQLEKHARCAIAVPAWSTKNQFIHLPLIDDLKKMGYNRVSFSYADVDDLIYHRPGQIVARELLVLTVV